MKKVIIKAKEGELTKELIDFALKAVDWFNKDLEDETYGSDWNSCGYGFGDNYATTKLNKSGTITVTVQ